MLDPDPGLPEEPSYFIARLRSLHLAVRDRLIADMQTSSVEQWSAVADVRGGDVMYELDAEVEQIIVDYCERWAREMPFVVVAEGFADEGVRVFPDGAAEADARFRLIVDPIDGTRGIMYDKRSAWVLSGVAPNRGPGTSLRDLRVAVQTEIPTTRQYLADMLWAAVGEGARGETHNVLTGEARPFTPRPSGASSIEHGFATISKFFPGGKVVIAQIEERLMDALVPPGDDGTPRVFDDEYISSGGQLYELAVGHDRFTADLRPLALLASAVPRRVGRLCAHPYDLCTELIAREAGALITDRRGRRLDEPLSIHPNLSWIGYANEAFRAQVEPKLLELLAELEASL